MLDAAIKTIAQMFSPGFRAMLLKAIGLALVLIVLIGVGLQRGFAWLAADGVSWAEGSFGAAPHAAWDVLSWILSIAAGLGIITGALFLMPAVTAFVGSFFVDEIAELVERRYYASEPPGRALPLVHATVQGVRTALLALLVYLCALPFVFFAGLGLIALFLANAYLLSREYFELAAMRFHPVEEAKALRRIHQGTVFAAGMLIALFVSIPIVNLATPLFAMALMVHMHKRVMRRELVEARAV